MSIPVPASEQPIRRARDTARFLSYIYLPLMGLGILALLYLGLSVSQQVSQVKSDQARQAKAAQANCLETNQQRAESNRHLRQPLKEAVTLAAGTAASRRQAVQLEQKFTALAAVEKDHGTKELFRILVGVLKGNPKLTAAYTRLATDIKLVPLLNCRDLASVAAP